MPGSLGNLDVHANGSLDGALWIGAKFSGHRQIIPDRIPDVVERLLLACALRPASRERRAPHGEPFVGPEQSHRVIHDSYFTALLARQAHRLHLNRAKGHAAQSTMPRSRVE